MAGGLDFIGYARGMAAFHHIHLRHLMKTHHWLGLSLYLVLNAWAAPTCQSGSAPVPPAVVELYTSQGCSSCPPADQWLSGLKGRTDVVALAFHVNYWNHLGWKDPFATSQTTQRQHAYRSELGSGYVYTPQVIVNGRDVRDWRGIHPENLPKAPGNLAPRMRMWREGNAVSLVVSALPLSAGASPTRLAGYWVVLQDGLRSKVSAGENSGVLLANDHVVKRYEPVGSWLSDHQQVLIWDAPEGASQRVVFVVTQAQGLIPLQALVLKCT